MGKWVNIDALMEISHMETVVQNGYDVDTCIIYVDELMARLNDAYDPLDNEAVRTVRGMNAVDLIKQMIEECCEVGKAGIKYLRSSGDCHSPTPVSLEQATADLVEEQTDVVRCWIAEGFGVEEFIEIAGDEKMQRWAERIQ